MPALRVGSIAPDVELPGIVKTRISLREELEQGPVVLAFFKISCPVCQYAFPFLQRMYRNYFGARVCVLGVSQDDEQSTRMFMREFGVTFPIAIDTPRIYPASNAYGITNVPTIFYISAEGEVLISSVGWSRKDMESISAKIAEHLGSGAPPIFNEGEQIADFRAG